MKSILCYLIIVIYSCSVYSKINGEEWIKFKDKYEKDYGSKEKKKFEIFKENFEFIQKHESGNGKSFDVDVNRFADLENEDFDAAEDFEPR